MSLPWKNWYNLGSWEPPLIYRPAHEKNPHIFLHFSQGLPRADFLQTKTWMAERTVTLYENKTGIIWHRWEVVAWCHFLWCRCPILMPMPDLDAGPRSYPHYIHCIALPPALHPCHHTACGKLPFIHLGSPHTPHHIIKHHLYRHLYESQEQIAVVRQYSLVPFPMSARLTKFENSQLNTISDVNTAGHIGIPSRPAISQSLNSQIKIIYFAALWLKCGSSACQM